MPELITIKRRDSYRRRQIRRRRRIIRGVSAAIFLLLVGAIIFFLLFSIKREVAIEYGQKLDAEMFRNLAIGSISIDDADKVETLPPGEHEVSVSYLFFGYDCKVTVVDTTSPVFSLKEISMGYGKELTAEDFIDSITELSPYTAEFQTAPNWQVIGTHQIISITVKDEWGNQATKDTTLFIDNYPQVLTVELGTGRRDIDRMITNTYGQVSYPELTDDAIGKVGTLPLELTNGEKVFGIDLNIVDTVPPKMELRDVTAPVGLETPAKVFVSRMDDLSPVEVSYVEAPDFSKEGTFDVQIKATDISGNETILGAKINLITDTEVPVFTVANDFDSFLGENIIYREKVIVTDNCTQDPEIKVDADSVNISTPGVYPVTYTATDLSGNSASATININIREKTDEERELDEKIKKIAGQIFTEGMNKREMADAVYNYVYHHITYVSRPKQNYVKAALEAIAGRGGCFNYASLAMYLFNEVDIKNMFMETDVHYWNIIDIDDGHGWYHFDATPSPEEPKIFLWTDEQMMAYSNRQNKTHHYDRSKYPHIP